MLAKYEFPIEGGYSFGAFRLDLERRQLYRQLEAVSLGPKPFWTLVFLIENRNRVVSKEELLKKVWVAQREIGTVHQAISHLRRALSDDAANPRFVEAVPGHGYRFIGNVTQITKWTKESLDGRPGNATESDSVTRQSQPQTGLAVSEQVHQPNGTPAEPPAVISHGTESPLEPRPVTGKLFVFGWQSFLVLALFALCLILAASWLRHPSPQLIRPERITHSPGRILSPLLTDGARVYYQRFDNGRYSVAEVAAGGGPSITVPIALSNPELCDLSPDGGSLLIRDLDPARWREGNQPVYIHTIIGSETTRVGDILAYDAAWSADGRHIIFTADGSFYRSDLDGKAIQKLLTLPGNAYWIRWSPDSSHFRFTLADRKTEATSLWEANPDGTSVHRVFPQLNNEEQQCCGSWTPDSRFFVFQVRDRSTFHIMARREKTSFFNASDQSPTQLSAGPLSYRAPAPSKDGKKLFVRAELPKAELVRFEPVSKRFVSLPLGISARTASFSDDGEWVAYGSLIDNNLWRSKMDGSQLIQLTSDFQQVAMARWSHNGHSIAFMGRRYGAKWSVFTIAAGGGNLHLFSSSDKGEGDPDWSPDDSRLVFGNVLERPTDVAIRTLDLRTGQIITLPGSAGYLSPRWSPDGRFITAVGAIDQRLYLFDFSSGKWSNLTKHSAGYPNWSHDGKCVYFFSPANEHRAIWRVGIANRKTEEIASLDDVEQPPTIFGTWIGLMPDDSPVAVRNLTTDDIYSWSFERN